ncbi:alpha/beta hydrolase [Tateyamaria omphalii]|uniref:alpha/beta fold hydrolase n=1 Tax=Tateyamaria omphalii TaxID=299262 RepID=UPI001C991380|nr:alpha/beta hydrolase [Tateyamaria omphalii]MBY5932166.1 alpha/beta hydrolase [Tateyamaria omphalii]
MRWLYALAAALWLTACAVQDSAPPSDPLIYDAAAMARADSAVLAIPGAMTSIRVLTPIERFATRDRAIAYFRLPGFDERPSAESVDLDRAAARIARLVQTYDLKRIDIIGHSTGAVIALEAAKDIRALSPNTEVRVSGISTALPAPQPILAGLRGAAGTVAAATRTRSLNPRKVWLEYYRRLAYGPDVETVPERAQAADALVEANTDRIELPENGLYRRHTRDLRRWTNPDPEALAGARITFYHGAVDPVFPRRPTQRFVDTLPGADITFIDGHGHLILLTYPQVWDLIGATLD